MTKIASYRDLIVWERGMELAELVYDVTEPFPKREHYGLAHQMRKSAVSIPSNIAEGQRRGTRAYVNHLTISLGSNGELDTQCELASRKHFIKSSEHERLLRLLDEIGRMTRGLRTSLDPSGDFQ